MDFKDLCPTNEDCDTEDGSPVSKLVKDWGYEPIMPANVATWEPLSSTTHVLVGLYLFAVGIPIFLFFCLLEYSIYSAVYSILNYTIFFRLFVSFLHCSLFFRWPGKGFLLTHCNLLNVLQEKMCFSFSST